MLYDTHCHLDYHNDEEIKDIIIRAKKAKLGHIMQAGTLMKDIRREIEISEKFSDDEIKINCAVSIHPENVKGEYYKADEIVKIANSNSRILAIGETGLDTHILENEDFLEKQIESFEQHIEASIITNKPLILHLRGDKAISKAIEILQFYSKNDCVNAVLHSYTGDYDNAKKALDCGFYISFSGIVTFKKADDLREVVKKIPPERMFVETDAPFLSPEPMRGKKNETSFVLHTANFLSNFLNMDYEDFCDKTTQNALKFFKNEC